MLLELSIDSISFNIYPEVYSVSYSEYDELIARVRVAGKNLL